MPEPKLQSTRWEKNFEDSIRQEWRDSRRFRFNPKSRRPVFSIDTPPPYVNAPVHIGQAAVYTIMDMIARYKRMTGYEVLFPIGLDRNGLPIEVATENEFSVSIIDTPREEFIKLCERLLEKSSLKSLESFYRLGHSYNSWNLGSNIGDIYYTDSEAYRILTQATFIDLWKMGLIYRDEKINNYCPKCRTTIADSEIEYRDRHTDFVYMKFKVKETGETIIIATTRPELICSCAMILYNPKDKRYKHLKGKHAVTPIYEKVIAIKPHTYAKKETGTGLVMMCSFGDYTDIRFFREQKLDPIISIDKHGRMNASAGFLEGLTVEEARKKMIEELMSRNLVEKHEKILHKTPVCERSGSPIEFIALPEYYLKQLGLRNDIKKIANKTRFYSPRSKQILLNWIDSLSMDWAISRRRYYATEIPLWYCNICLEPVVPEKGRYYRPWKEKAPIEKCPKCGATDFVGEERVFDTWFDSSISPLYILRFGENKRFFEESMPCSLRPQGKEIVRTWLYYTLLRCYQLIQKPVFASVWIHYHVLDEQGHKMSKSLGNVIKPEDVMDKYGAEAFRIWCALEGNITTDDIKCSFERIEGASKFLTKLWNVSRFVSVFRSVKKPARLSETDRWILKELNNLVEFAIDSYEHYDFHNPIIRMKHFIWETFASHYLELVKSRAYNQEKQFTKSEQQAALYTLNRVLDSMLLLLSPVACFITHKIYRDLRGRDIEDEPFPRAGNKYAQIKLQFKTAELVNLNSRIWKKKKDKGLSLKAPIKKAIIPRNFKGLEKDLRVAHNIQHLEFGKQFRIWI